MLVGAWLTGFFWIGQATAALADDGLINGPDLGTAGGQTVFEQYGPDRFALYLQLSNSNHGAPYVSEAMWNILRSIESALMYLIGALARGAITSMQWMLNLHLYSDNSGPDRRHGKGIGRAGVLAAVRCHHGHRRPVGVRADET